MFQRHPIGLHLRRRRHGCSSKRRIQALRRRRVRGANGAIGGRGQAVTSWLRADDTRGWRKSAGPSVSYGCRGCIDGWRRPAEVVCAITASFGRGRERHMAVAAGVTIDARVAPFKDLGVVMARSNAEATMFGDAWRAA